MPDGVDGPTLGEMWRSLLDLKATITALDTRLAALRTDLSRELETQIDHRVAVLSLVIDRK